MSECRWVLKNAAGDELRSTEAFESREAAEGWMGSEWASLLDEGAETVVLVEGDKTLYEMGLREA